MTEQVYTLLLTGVFPAPPETGGLLGGGNSVVDCVAFDSAQPCTNSYQYRPDVAALNRVLQQWAQQGIAFCGMFHTHPDKPGYERLSGADIDYIRAVMQCAAIDGRTLYFPIVMPQAKIVPYAARLADGNLCIEKTELLIIAKEAKP